MKSTSVYRTSFEQKISSKKCTIVTKNHFSGDNFQEKSYKILVLAHFIYSVCEKLIDRKMSSTSGTESTSTTVQSKLDIEAFRQHLLNYRYVLEYFFFLNQKTRIHYKLLFSIRNSNLFRSKPDDSELDLSYQLELDSSFKRMLDEKRQMTNKENDPKVAPPSAVSAVEPSTSANPIEKPLRRDLLKERLLHRIQDESLGLDNSASYIGENSISNDIEFAAINRLMADFNINRDSTIGQKRSPLKALRITGEMSIDDDAFMPSVRKLQSSRAELSSRAERSITKEESVNADDTLEEIEYVKTKDRGLNYVPKRLIQKEKESHHEKQFDNENDENNDENQPIDLSESIEKDDKNTTDGDVIVIESSPESSFTTTQNTGLYKSAFESTNNTFYTAKTNLNSKSINSMFINDESMPNVDYDKKNNSPIDDDDDATLEDKSFERLSNNTSRNLSELHFNDSLERVEYMMRKGEQTMKNLTPSVKLTPSARLTPSAKMTPSKPSSIIKSHTTKTPTTRTPIGGAVKKVLPLSSGKKPTAKAATPNKGVRTATPIKGVRIATPNQVDIFKRPIRSPQVQTQSYHGSIKSKIPTLNAHKAPVISSINKPQFRHIASPIAAYINHTPEVPFIKTIKPVKNLMTNDVYNKIDRATNSLDETTQSVESFPVKSALPKKMYISAPQRQVCH